MTKTSHPRKQFLRLLALGFVVLGLTVAGAPSWNGAVYASEGGSCQQC